MVESQLDHRPVVVGRCGALDGTAFRWHVEYVSGERRQNEFVRTCAWCGRVHTGANGWQQEQRSLPPSVVLAICPTCAVDYRRPHERPTVPG